MELAKSPQKAHPTPPAKSPRKRKTSRTYKESATARELRKWYFYQKAVDVYGGMRRRFNLVGTIEDKLSGPCDKLCKSALSTDMGTAADDIVAMGVRQANVATMRVSSPMPRIQASLVKTKERLVRGAIHYFPLFVLARWAVDLTLVTACLILALMKDVFRIADGQKDFVYSEEKNAVVMQPAQEWRGVDSDDEEQDGTAYADGSPVVSPMDANKSARAVRMRMSPAKATATANPAPVEKSSAIASPAAVENQSQNECGGQDVENVRVGDNDATAGAAQDGNVREVDNRNLVEYIEGFKREHSDIASVMESFLDKVRSATCYILVITIPVVLLKICTLRFLSKRVHNMTKGFDGETIEDCKRRREMFHRLIGTQPEGNNLKPLGPNKWLLDIVIDHYVASVMKWMVIGRVLAYFVSRPVNLFARLSKANHEMLYLRNETVDYLKEDPDYDEDQDPDYEPEDDDGAEDDSLEYKDDAELEPDEMTENIDFDNTQPNQTAPTRNMSTPRKKTRASKSPVESEYRLSADKSPGGSPPGKLTSNAQTSHHGKRKSGVQATSTPKDESKKVDNQGKSAKEKKENATAKSLSFEEDEPIILVPLPLSPERLKRIQMRRDPIQAAVMRMKADRIIEARKRMMERKQELKNKTKPRPVIKTKNSYEVINEAQERETGESLDTNLVRSDCYAQNDLRNDEADDDNVVSPCDKQQDHNNTPGTNTRSKSEADSINVDVDAPEYGIEKESPKFPKSAEHQEFREWLRENASNTPAITRKQDACDFSQDKGPHKAICISSSPTNGSEATLKSSDTDNGSKESHKDSEISITSENPKLSEGFSPKSLEVKATAPSPPRSSDLHGLLEADHDMRSSSVDTGHSVAGR